MIEADSTRIPLYCQLSYCYNYDYEGETTMTQFEHIPPQPPLDNLKLKLQSTPELVREDDPASYVMQPLTSTKTLFIQYDDNINTATQAVKIHHTPLLLVMEGDSLVGLISSEDLLGEKPITLQQKSRIQREDITVKMLMTPLKDILVMTLEDVMHARVGNIVATLKQLNQHYALVTSNNDDKGETQLHGIFNTAQISKQLHKDIQHALYQIESISKLEKEL